MVALDQLLVKVLHREVGVNLAVKPQHAQDLLGRRAAARRLANPTIKQTRRPLVTKPIPPAPKGALRNPQHLRSLDLAQLTALMPIQQTLKPHLSYLLQHSCPAHLPLSFRAVLKPDRSRATKSGQITSQPHSWRQSIDRAIGPPAGFGAAQLWSEIGENYRMLIGQFLGDPKEARDGDFRFAFFGNRCAGL